MDLVSPLSPVACNWYKYRYDCAHVWEVPYLDSIYAFKLLLGKDLDVATQETINLG